MDKKTKIFIWIIVAVFAAFILYAIFARKTETISPGTTTTTQGGLLDTIVSLFGAASGSGTTAEAGGLGGWLSGLFGGKPKSKVECDPNKPGYDVNGFAQPECGFGG